MSEPIAYGIYLIPPPELAYHIALAHLLLKSAFGLEAGGKFMPHCTLVAFLHPREGAGATELAAMLDQILPHHQPFPLEFRLETERFIRLQLAEHPNLMNLQAELRREVDPFLSEYGRAKRSETSFHPHITLAFRDLPQDEGLLKQVEAFCRQLYQKMPKENLTGNLFQLIEFKLAEGKSWDAPDYWFTLRWRILKGYTLAASS